MKIDAMRPAKWISFSLLFLFLLFTVLKCYRSPFSASDLETVPDSVEYAISAQHFALWGRYEIEINHHAYPPRYAPWFPVMMLSPIYAVFPKETGNGIIAILICSVLCVLVAFKIGVRVGGNWGGFLSAFAVALSPVFVQWSRQIMSDVPTLLFALLAGLHLLKMFAEPKRKDYLIAGIYCAIAYAFRNVYGALLLPFLFLLLRQGRQAVPALLLFLAPVLVVSVATGIYNLKAFGEWGRTGYHYWCAVPYDYLGLVFSPRYLGKNLALFRVWEGWLPLLLGAIGFLLLHRTKSEYAPPIRLFTFLAVLPLSFVQMLYFVPDLRFFLLLLVWLLVVGGAGLGALLQRRLSSERFAKLEWGLVGICVVVVFVTGIYRPDELYGKRAIVEILNEILPQDGVLVTALDPVYLEPMLLRGNQRQIIPLSRSVEYASKLIVRRRVPVLEPAPASPIDHRCVALKRSGAEEVITETADEKQGSALVNALLRSGRAIFLDGSPTSRGDVAFSTIASQYRIEATATHFLYRIVSSPRN